MDNETRKKLIFSIALMGGGVFLFALGILVTIL